MSPERVSLVRLRVVQASDGSVAFKSNLAIGDFRQKVSGALAQFDLLSASMGALS